jgi:hypothetical protein
MGTVRDWWQKLTGQKPAQGTAAPKPAAAHETPDAPGLQLTAAPEPKQPARVGAAGFDPYSSDAGFAKPHSWERVDHD